MFILCKFEKHTVLYSLSWRSRRKHTTNLLRSKTASFLYRLILISFKQAISMLGEETLFLHVPIPVSNLEKGRKILTSIVVNKLLGHLSNLKAFECGYVIKVTKLISIGDADTEFLPRYVYFPVEFRCSTFKPMSGEIMNGIVYKVCSMGVFLKSGPMKMVYLSAHKMPNYSYVSSEKVHMKEDMSRIEIGVVVRFVVLAEKWEEDKWREFRVLASIDGDGLGPVSLNGVDEFDTSEVQEYPI